MTAPTVLYTERLWPAPWVFISTALIIPASLLVSVPINIVAGLIIAPVLYAAIVVLLLTGTPAIIVSSSELRAGKARLPLAVIESVAVHTGEDARLERGQRLDARAWLLIRGWIGPVVVVALKDERDPTPYWLLSTRKPDALAHAIATARASATEGAG